MHLTNAKKALVGRSVVVFLFLLAGSARAQTVTSTISVGSGWPHVAVNPVTNKVYVANGPGDEPGASVTVIDGATNTATTVALDKHPGCFGDCPTPVDIALNPVTNKVYVVSWFSNDVAVIDGATNTTTTVAAGQLPAFAAVNPVTGKIYVSNFAGVTVLTEQQVQAIPLTTAISALPNNRTANPNPGFTFDAASGFSPTAPAVEAVYFQVDTWQGSWTPARATRTPGTFLAYVPAL